MAASDKDLGELHSALTREITERIKGYEDFTEDGKSIVRRATAAELAVAVTLLKNNNITADASDNAELKALSTALTERRKKKLTPLQLEEALESYSQVSGLMQ